ncbi:hypothetical protein ACFXPZ_03465 [Streptomyces sp. NPDC059101]|uniref:hypothetical protein n=1 Tax=Streptomyces sp. NPDC059101 TaxID=3346728 RepID=UPI0036C8BACB
MLNGLNPAAAAAKETTVVTYDGGGFAGNWYKVKITATVTRIGDRYELSALVESRCIHDEGPAPEWGLAFGSSAESWRYEEGTCSPDWKKVTLKETGPLRRDGRVYLQAGAYGGLLLGSWGWGTQRSVWV